MKTKEKSRNLIFVSLLCSIFFVVFGLNSNVFATKIEGTVIDESSSPIENIGVDYGGIPDVTDGGYYEVENPSSPDTIKYTFRSRR